MSRPSDYFRNWGSMSKALDGFKLDKVYFGQHRKMSDYVFEYEYSMSMMNKGSEMELEQALPIVTSIDLSNNRFDGEIPSSMGKLQSLTTFNLSSNNFTRTIPSPLGNIRELESSDLSKNKSSGRIPQTVGKSRISCILKPLAQSNLRPPYHLAHNWIHFHPHLSKEIQDHVGLNCQRNVKIQTHQFLCQLSKDEEESENCFTWRVVAVEIWVIVSHHLGIIRIYYV